MCLRNLLTLVLFLTVIGCKKSDTVNPTLPDPVGQQRTIPWPSLATSPWPMNHADPQSSGRSRYHGPSMGVLDWSFDTVYTEGGVVMGSDSVIVFPGMDTKGKFRLYFQRGNGTLKDTVPASASSVTPLVAADGTIYIGGYDGKLRAFTSSGSPKWTFNAGSSIAQQGMNLGLDGTIFFMSTSSVLFAVTASGQLSWQITDTRFNNGTHCVLSFSPDGQMLYVPGGGPLLLAVSISSRSVAWTFGRSYRDALAPIVDSDGHIYMLGPADTVHSSVPALYCLNPDGSLHWVYPHGNTFDIVNAADPTIDINGNISFAIDTLYSVDYSGKLRWKTKLDNWADSPLVCDADGTLYLTIVVASRATHTIAVSPGGTELWRYTYNPTYMSDTSPAITADGRLLLLDSRGRNLYCLK